MPLLSQADIAIAAGRPVLTGQIPAMAFLAAAWEATP
jgi:hypothetical protein